MSQSRAHQDYMLLEQLRREASLKRIPVSEAVEDMKAYIAAHQDEDCLLVGFTSQKANPYREKSSCDII